MKNFILILTAFILFLPAFAFEDYIITSNGKLTDIKIQHNDIIDVFPLITIMNDKNTLIVHPLKEGSTKFTVLKNNKDKYLFDVKVTDNETTVKDVSGFEIMAIDCPPGYFEYYFDLDEPPLSDSKNNNYSDIDSPPMLRGAK